MKEKVTARTHVPHSAVSTHIPTRKILFKGGMAGTGAVKPVVEFMATILGGDDCRRRAPTDRLSQRILVEEERGRTKGMRAVRNLGNQGNQSQVCVSLQVFCFCLAMNLETAEVMRYRLELDG